MKNKKISEVYDVAKQGYVILSRNAIRHLLDLTKEQDGASLYCRLLLEAHYGAPKVISDTTVLRRGEVLMPPAEIAEFTGWKKSKIYDALKELEKEGLLKRLDAPGQSHYLLPKYEEHSGRSARKEEHPSATGLKDNKTETSFLAFFDYYHFTTGIPKSDKEKARREWTRLSTAEREEATHNIPRYKATVRKAEYLKLACNYLKDKSFKF